MKVAAQCSKLGYTVAPMEQRAELVVGRALVVVVDDRTAHGDEDHSGPLVTELLT
ncbi:molybdenum cofactor biosynthesis protein, partial [Mycobacterium tuberculosis]